MFGTLISVLSLFLLVWLGWAAFHQFLLAFAGIFYKNPLSGPAYNTVPPQIRVFIPAYREDAVIENTVRQTLLSDYPAERCDIVVIADGLQPATLARLRLLPVQVLELQFEKSTKAKALNAAIQLLEAEDAKTGETPQMAVVLDADNAPARDFLARMAGCFRRGAQAVQGRRAPKNMESPFALLDAASEDANNHILCRGARVLGWSARLAGSGMAFEYAIFTDTMRGIEAVGGFDKALEGHLTKRGICIEYDDNAVVYDEKVAQSNNFSRQRSRWIAAQFKHFGLFFPDALRLFFRNGNADFLQKTLQMALPPRLLTPGCLALGAAIHYLIQTGQTPFWIIAFTFNLMAFALALPAYLFQKQNRRVWLHLPVVFFATLRALVGLREASQVFIVTPKVC